MDPAKRWWATSQDAEEMLLDATSAGCTPKEMTPAVCACVRLALVHVPPSDPLPQRALAAAEAWARGQMTRQKAERIVITADHNSYTAAETARDATAVAAGRVVSDPPGAIALVCHAVADAVANAAPLDWITALGGVAEREAMRRMAGLVRAHLPWATVAAARGRT